jgi:hypothetical protein
MSPAEITSQLGLQTLTRRAWVSELLYRDCPLFVFLLESLLIQTFSSSNPPVPPPVTVFTRVWSGSPMRSGKPTAIKVYNANSNRTCS